MLICRALSRYLVIHREHSLTGIEQSTILYKQIVSARLRFPCGLYQPPGSYRFGLEALLLAAYALQYTKGPTKIADLGCGCGASDLALAITNPDIFCVGFDREPELIGAANQNASLLGVRERTKYIETDISQIDKTHFNSFNIVLANPPWHSGKVPIAPLRRRALMKEPSTLSLFCATACKLLRPRGLYCLILPASLIPELFSAVHNLALGVRQMLAVASFAGQPAKRVLCLLQKDAASDLRLPPPLTLRRKTSTGSCWTEAILAFCPWLGAK